MILSLHLPFISPLGPGIPVLSCRSLSQNPVGLNLFQNGSQCSLKGNHTLYCGVSSLHFCHLVALYPHFCHSLSTFWSPCILAGPHTRHDPAPFRNITCNCPFRLQSFYPCGLSTEQPSRTTSTKTTPPFHCFHFPFSYFSRKPITSRHERVTSRKARGLQMEEMACKCQTFLSLLSGRKKQTSDIFSFSIQI